MAENHEGAATVEATTSVTVHGVRISTQLLPHWAQIVIGQEEAAHSGRADVTRQYAEARRTGGPTELSLELHPSMLCAAATAAAIESLYAEVVETVVAKEVRKRQRCRGTPTFARIYDALTRGFHAKTRWRGELEWLFQEQRNAPLHGMSRGDIPHAHPLGTSTAPEYTIYTSENSERAVDLMLDVLETCVARPRPQLEQWAANVRRPVTSLVTARRAASPASR